MPISGELISSGKAIGGSESACIQMASTLAKKDHRPIIFCDTEQAHAKDGVTFGKMSVNWRTECIFERVKSINAVRGLVGSHNMDHCEVFFDEKI